jgi:hypothetical protein
VKRLLFVIAILLEPAARAVTPDDTYEGPVQLEVRLQPLRGGATKVLSTVTLEKEPDYPLFRVSPDRGSFAYLAGGKLLLRGADGRERDLGSVDGAFAFSRDGQRIIAINGGVVVNIELETVRRRKLPARHRDEARRADLHPLDEIDPLPELDYGEWIGIRAFAGGVVGVSRYWFGRVNDAEGLLF